MSTQTHSSSGMGGDVPLTWMEKLQYRAAAEATGRLVENRALSEMVARALVARASLPFGDLEDRLRHLLTACRRTEDPELRARLHELLRPYLQGEAAGVWREKKIGWERYYGSFGKLNEQKALTKTLVLKAPGPNGEKGVLYAPFEYNLMRLIANHDARAVLSEYLIVGASSWSPTDFAPLANLAGLSRDPIFLGISNVSDMDAYRVMSPVVRPVPMLASDLTDPDFYRPEPRENRDIDILMVANWMRFKRHWLLFEALRDMPRNLRVVFVGRSAPGRTERELRAEAKAFGAPQEIEYITNIPIQEVTRLQCSARVSAVFSHREGSCLAVTESFFADTPVAVMEDGHIGSKSYINPQTGILCTRKGLSRQLNRFLEESDSYRPRDWAVGNIDCYTTSDRVNGILREYSLEAGLPWTEDIVPFCRRYVPEYARPEDKVRMEAAEEQLRERHGVELEKFVYRP